MQYAALLTLLSLALACPAMAKPHHFHRHQLQHHHQYTARGSRDAKPYAAHAPHSETAHVSHSGITCEMVRAYVAQVGLSQAIAMAKTAGITAAEEQRAKQCLAKKI